MNTVGAIRALGAIDAKCVRRDPLLRWIAIGPVLLALLAPLAALFLAAFAANKVQGFALMKAAGVINWPPMMAYFIDGPWQLACGLVPTYWPAELYWMLCAGDPGWWVYLVIGLLFQLLLLAVLLRRFNRVMHR